MLSKESFPVYAQFHEDIILAALLYRVKKGFYVDVGANNESLHSVTKYFYERGWNGLNIEPIERLAKELKKSRGRDITLQLALSTNKGKLKFREYPKHDGLSSLSFIESNKDLSHVDYEVDVDRLDNILDKLNIQKIDFLKIDVEGNEFEVLKSNNWNKYRPTVICIEANHRQRDWNEYLVKNGYRKFIFDGLNEYYVAEASKDIVDGFAERAATLAFSGLRAHHYQAFLDDQVHIKNLREFADKQDTQIKNINKSLEHYKRRFEEVDNLSLKDKKLLDRMKIVYKGLTSDYFKYKSRS